MSISTKKAKLEKKKDNKNTRKSPAISLKLSSEGGELCPICLDPVEQRNLAVTPKCFHQFCITCIRCWGLSAGQCPLCKTPFDSIIHRILGPTEFTVSRLDGDLQEVPVWNSQRHIQRRLYYSQGMRSIPFKSDLTKMNCQAISSDPKYWKMRLLPWLTHELQSLLRQDDVELFVLLIFNLLGKNDVLSSEFAAELSQHLDLSQSQIDMFIHELRCFGNSFLPMDRYDKVVIRSPASHPMRPVQEIIQIKNENSSSCSYSDSDSNSNSNSDSDSNSNSDSDSNSGSYSNSNSNSNSNSDSNSGSYSNDSDSDSNN